MPQRRAIPLFTLPVLLAAGLGPAKVLAIDFFCNPEDLCSLVPTEGGLPAYNTTDPSKPWVAGGDVESAASCSRDTVGARGPLTCGAALH